MKAIFLVFLGLLLSLNLHAEGDLQLWPYGEKSMGHFPRPSVKFLDLSMAKNEFEIALFHLPKIDSKLTLVPLTEVNLKWEKVDPNISWTVSTLGVQNINQSSYTKNFLEPVPDIVVPLNLLNDKNFHIPVANISRNPWYMIEFFVPASVNEGVYKGVFSFKCQNQKFEFPVSIEVDSYALPQRFRLKNTIGFAPWQVLKKHYGKWHSGEVELYKKYFEQATDHRIDLHKIYYRFPPYNKKSSNDLLGHKDEHESFYEYWMTLYQGRESARAFKWNLTDLPVPEEFKHNIDSKALDYWKAMEISVKKNKLSENTFVYFMDEPKKEQFLKMKMDLKNIREVAPDLKFMITHHYDFHLDQMIDLWCVNYNEWDKKPFPTPEFYKKHLESFKKEELWFYTSCNAHGCSNAQNNHEPDFVIDRPTSYLRVFPWLALYYGANGILYYDSVYGYNKEGNSPWHDDFNFTGNGDGNLFYPCNPEFCGKKEQFPLVSLRMKILRDGLEDAEIAAEAMNKIKDGRKQLELFLRPPRQFPDHASQFNQKKKEYLKLLN